MGSVFAQELSITRGFGDCHLTGSTFVHSSQLVENENVRGVVTMNEDYETRYFANNKQVNRFYKITMKLYCMCSQ